MPTCYKLMQGTFENFLVDQEKKKTVKCLVEMSKEKGQSKSEVTGYFLQEKKAKNLILICYYLSLYCRCYYAH